MPGNLRQDLGSNPVALFWLRCSLVTGRLYQSRIFSCLAKSASMIQSTAVQLRRRYSKYFGRNLRKVVREEWLCSASSGFHAEGVR